MVRIMPTEDISKRAKLAMGAKRLLGRRPGVMIVIGE